MHDFTIQDQEAPVTPALAREITISVSTGERCHVSLDLAATIIVSRNPGLLEEVLHDSSPQEKVASPKSGVEAQLEIPKAGLDLVGEYLACVSPSDTSPGGH